jgi:hypothetical protein
MKIDMQGTYKKGIKTPFQLRSGDGDGGLFIYRLKSSFVGKWNQLVQTGPQSVCLNLELHNFSQGKVLFLFVNR